MKKNIVFLYIAVIAALAASIYCVIGLNSNSKEQGTLIKNDSPFNKIMLKVFDGHLQWKYEDDDSWTKLIDISTLKGKDGKDGKDGTNGKDGVDGKDGVNGTNGKDGVDGKDGINGTNGKDGVDGKDGQDGTPGKDGINGTNGKDGREVEFRTSGNYIQWRYVGESDDMWRNLFDLSTLGGSTGGDTGDDTPTSPDDSLVTNDISALNIVTAVDGDSTNLGCYTNGTECTPGTLMSVKVNDSETLDFYVLSDADDVLTLISASNIGDKVAWYEGSKGDKTVGPVTALEALMNATSTWDNIYPISSYTYANESTNSYKQVQIQSGKITLTGADDSSLELLGTANARLLTKEEASDFGCKSSSSTSTDSCPLWLTSNLGGDNHEGYWLLTSASGTDASAYNIRMKASNSTFYLYTNSTTTTTYNGVRPVIQIKKTTAIAEDILK